MHMHDDAFFFSCCKAHPCTHLESKGCAGTGADTQVLQLRSNVT